VLSSGRSSFRKLSSPNANTARPSGLASSQPAMKSRSIQARFFSAKLDWPAGDQNPVGVKPLGTVGTWNVVPASHGRQATRHLQLVALEGAAAAAAAVAVLRAQTARVAALAGAVVRADPALRARPLTAWTLRH